ncbi:MAG: ATP-binding protein [Acidimicrobiales bacterium]
MTGAVEWTIHQRWSYAASTASVATARADVAHFLADTTHVHRIDDVRLMVSELVTNVILHTSGHPTMEVGANATLLRVEVIDQSSAGAVVQAPPLNEPDGRGLMIVTVLADAWGVTHHSVGKAVWFEVRT